MSFFKAPSWARSQTVKAEDHSERNIFSHSDNFLDVQKERLEREEKRKVREREKEERRKAKQEEKQRRSSSEKRKIKEEDRKGSLKKRRITAEDSARLLAGAGLGGSITISDSEDDAQQQLQMRRSPRTARTKDVFSPAKPRSRNLAPVHTNDASEDEVEITAVPLRPARAQPEPKPEPEEEVDSDPEIAEIQRKARAKARLKEQAKAAKSATAQVSGSLGNDEAGDGSPSSTPPLHDATIELLIESPIPGTAPLIAFRKLSQSLRIVRKRYCEKQGFSEEFSKKVCLTHNGRRYYDSSTVQRLGISADASGRVYLENDPSFDGVEKVVITAMTEDMFKQLKHERERQALVEAGEYIGEQEGAKPSAEEEDAPAPRRAINLIVKAKNKKDWKVQAFNDIAFQKIIKHAKKAFGFAPDQEVSLEFDGELLNPDDLVGSTDLDDMDQLEMLLVK
ncbi:hypothetical protein CLAFUW4_10304 [Fulvia fulva]|uniref:Rad60/SUMO-like domain-containing protein n=1 Tax=Passalora fulva TaxID=5499 RepID=A0A9Q8P801_PASFU|nr:uncharacterized protein CLAFUR5_04917 [Fulvia fulva]KAK4615810.1 hypothetical protein CLAFUR4_10308 [Fulvia fulva]KAK4616744.1 hypothetical protein CLAFUR0_10306 [Fulvia fulva]UJO16680.1 hypothetical protein CLAFUR5_04917 [Fulvia fulva]WPV19005.1 hypothetical protein CLAFUW4_10304 [Fulvia fulva]WPV33911.1 hypothetical protein CLAFUW7_10304 [Fulvia fulva]